MVVDLLDRRLTLTDEEETTLATLTKTEEFEETDLPLTGFLRRAVLEGRAEGRVEGRIEGKSEILLRLVMARFGAIPEETRARLQAVRDEAVLDQLLGAVLTADSLDALVAGR